MIRISITDISGAKPGPSEGITKPGALKLWWKRAERGELRMWDFTTHLFSGRFALGGGVAAGLLVCGPEGDGPYWMQWEGEPGEGVPIASDGFEDELPAESRTTPARLLEVVLHLLENEGAFPKGIWDIDGERVDTRQGDAPPEAPLPTSAPTAYGSLTKRLVALMQKGPTRGPLPEVLKLFPKSGDPDFQAYLYAYAHHRNDVDCGDWMEDSPRLEGGDIHFGRSGGGDPYLMRGRSAIVVWHETGEEETYAGFEGFLSDLQFRVHDRGGSTDLD